jgi:glutaredoxin 3
MYTAQWCPYCTRARSILESRRLAFETVDVDAHPGARAEMLTRSGRRTVPQIFIGATHVGGCDDLEELVSSGKLDQLLTEGTEK